MDLNDSDDLILAFTPHIDIENFTGIFEIPHPHLIFKIGTYTLQAFVSIRNTVYKIETQKMALLNKARTIIVENTHEYYAFV